MTGRIFLWFAVSSQNVPQTQNLQERKECDQYHGVELKSTKGRERAFQQRPLRLFLSQGCEFLECAEEDTFVPHGYFETMNNSGDGQSVHRHISEIVPLAAPVRTDASLPEFISKSWQRQTKYLAVVANSGYAELK